MGSYFLTNDQSVLLEVDKAKLGFEVAIYDLNTSTSKPSARVVGKDPYKAIGQAVVAYVDKCNPSKGKLKGSIEIYERIAS